MFDLHEEVMRAQLLDERGLDYIFRHVLFQQAIHESISEPRRRALHALVAETLAETNTGPDEPVEKIAYHYVRAGNVPEAVGYLILAADRAESVYAHEDALRLLREALSLIGKEEDVDMIVWKRDLYERAGDVFRAQDEFPPIFRTGS